MRLLGIATVAAVCTTSNAFSDSSPFVLFSTAKIPTPGSQEQLQSSSKVIASTKEILASCPTDRYLLVSQANLNAAHLSSKTAVPNLYKSLEKAESRFSIAEVAGELDLNVLSDYIRESCGRKEQNPWIEEISLAPMNASPGSEQTSKSDDDELDVILEQYTAEGSYTIIYTAGTRTEKPAATYTPVFQDSVHTELKRHLLPVGTRQEKNGRDTRPLFEKYQFFTPGIFMALVMFIILMSILYSGISAVASLDVSYGAFDKDMAPAAQKKQQ